MGKALDDRYRAADRLSRVVVNLLEIRPGICSCIPANDLHMVRKAAARYQKEHARAQAEARS